MKKLPITILTIAITMYSGAVLAAEYNPNYDKAGENLGVPTEICTVTSEPCRL